MNRTAGIVDNKRRIVLPRHFRKGDVVQVEQESADTLIVRRMKAAPIPAKERPRLVRRKDGTTVFVGGPPVNSDIVRKLLEDFP